MVTPYVASASIVGPLRQRRGAVQRSVSGNWCVLQDRLDGVDGVVLKRLQLCNKCGLFERTHSAPRPKEFPRKRRSQPAPVRQSMNPPLFNGQGYYHYSDYPKDISLTPNAFGTVDGETPPQDTSWMTQIVPHVSSIPSHISPYPTTAEQPRIFGTDHPSLYTVPSATTCTASPSWELLPPHVNRYHDSSMLIYRNISFSFAIAILHDSFHF